ncbi:MAG: hypothetical protein H3C30_16225 [Candidatus Hydrogenedentes bacterium]|nr:hypothetical protein [Candidatus Hydrogenedentota bacterium]
MPKRPVDFFGREFTDAQCGSFSTVGTGGHWENPRAKTPGKPPKPTPPPTGTNWQQTPTNKKETPDNAD